MRFDKLTIGEPFEYREAYFVYFLTCIGCVQSGGKYTKGEMWHNPPANHEVKRIVFTGVHELTEDK